MPETKNPCSGAHCAPGIPTTTEEIPARGRTWTQTEKQNVIDKLWLNYFNDTLFAKGLISETDRNRMRNRISARTPQTKNKGVAR